MKKLILISLAALAGIFVLLSVMDRDGEYLNERQLWTLNREFADLAQHKESAPEFSINQLITKYRSFVKSNTKSTLRPRAQLLLGNVYIFNKDYAGARKEFKVVGTLTKDIELIAEAQANTGKAYEAEGQWGNALKAYRANIKDYPTTRVGFVTPLYIARHYEAAGQKENMSVAFDEAVGFYQNIADKHPKSPLEYNSLRMVALSRLAQEKWDDLLNVTETLMLEYPVGSTLEQGMTTINGVCATKLHDYDRAIGIYNRFLAKHPKHPVVPVVKKMISSFETLKVQGTIINPSTK